VGSQIKGLMGLCPSPRIFGLEPPLHYCISDELAQGPLVVVKFIFRPQRSTEIKKKKNYNYNYNNKKLRTTIDRKSMLIKIVKT